MASVASKMSKPPPMELIDKDIATGNKDNGDHSTRNKEYIMSESNETIRGYNYPIE